MEPPSTPVIDVDAHYEPSADWLDEFPSLRDELPRELPDTDPRFRMDTGEMFAYFVSDDLLRNVPREQRMPIERLVLETDSPYLPPQTHRGQRNDPSHLPAIADAIAIIKRKATADVCRPAS